MMSVMSSVSRKTRLAAALTSTVGPSPFAVTTVFPATRSTRSLAKEVVIVPIKPQLSSRITASYTEITIVWSLRRMLRRELRTAWFLRRLEFHQFDPRLIRIEDVKLPLAVSAHLRLLAIVRLPAVRFQSRLRFWHVGHAQ